jgi:hypothetical protein
MSQAYRCEVQGSERTAKRRPFITWTLGSTRCNNGRVASGLLQTVDLQVQVRRRPIIHRLGTFRYKGAKSRATS